MVRNTKESPQKNVEFLFLASHGLLSPISAIRWGCNRLKRTDIKKLSKQQLDLLNHIQSNARVLSKLFGSMLMLARNEDRTYTLRPEALDLKPLLTAEIKEWERLENGKVSFKAADALGVNCDSAIIESVIQNIFTVFSEAGTGAKRVSIQAAVTAGGMQELSFIGTMEMPFLQSVRTADNLSEERPIVGGTPGLLLSLSHALIGFADGRLEMREADKGSYVIVLRLPAA